MKLPGKIITFEGIETAGKGVQIELTTKFLEQLGVDFFVAREPGGTLTGEMLRVILKNPALVAEILAKNLVNHSDFLRVFDHWQDRAEKRTPECEAFMFFASRAEFADKILKPRTSQGQVVICDRLHDSTRAYQGGCRFYSDKQKIEWIKTSNRIALDGFWPDLTIFLDIPVKTMFGRLKKESPDKFAFFEKNCDTAFFERARAEYLAIALEEPKRFIRVNGELSPTEVFAQIKPLLTKTLGL